MSQRKEHRSMSSGSQGYTDEVATEVHDLMDQAEHEDETIHPERYTDEIGQQQSVKKSGLGSSEMGGQQNQSKLDKVKQTLNMNQK